MLFPQEKGEEEDARRKKIKYVGYVWCFKGGTNIQDDGLRLEHVTWSWALSSRLFFGFSCNLLQTVAA